MGLLYMKNKQKSTVFVSGATVRGYLRLSRAVSHVLYVWERAVELLFITLEY